MSINSETRVCSEHFVEADGRLLRHEEVPSHNLSSCNLPSRTLPSTITNKRKSPKKHLLMDSSPIDETCDHDDHHDVATQTADSKHVSGDKEVILKENIAVQQDLVNNKEQLLEKQKFRLMNIKDDANQMLFYTGFLSYGMLKAFFDFLDQLPMHCDMLIRQLVY